MPLCLQAPLQVSLQDNTHSADVQQTSCEGQVLHQAFWLQGCTAAQQKSSARLV